MDAKGFLFGLLLFLVAVSGTAQALRLADGLYFTVTPNSTAEVYFILPDDMGAGLGRADYFITAEANWTTDLTEQTVTTEENNTAIIPIKFYSSDKKEGDCSNFTVSISAPELGISRSWKGGVCLSGYADADISLKGGEPESVLNGNADLFSLGFRTYIKNAKPGEDVSLELLVQSQASLTIDVSISSGFPFERKSFAVQTGSDSQQDIIALKGAASQAGQYEVKATGKARNCPLDSCSRQAVMMIVVSEEEPQEGFSVSVFPDNLAIKALEPVGYSFTVQNSYAEEKNFVVDLMDRPFGLDSSFILDTVTVPGISERTVNFTVTPRNQTGFYEIKVRASLGDMEKVASAYLSTNEMVSDIYRNLDDAKEGANASVKASLDRSVKSWYSSYSKSEYGSNLTGYASLQEAIDSSKKSGEQAPSDDGSYVPDEGSGDVDGQESGSWWVFLVPVVLGVVVFAVLIILRRRRGPGKEDYSLDGLRLQ